MPIITFISDFGVHDHYTAAVKARILSNDPSQVIVDISHQIEHFNIAHGSFVLGSVFRDFPEGSIHLCGVNDSGRQGDAHIALKLENHFFLGCDNGLFGLLSEQEPESIVVLTNTPQEKELIPPATFPTRDVLAPAASRLAKGETLESLGSTTTSFKRMTPRKARATRKLIAGHVVHVDHYGNLITNIERTEFEFLLQDKYKVQIGREVLHKIHKAYHMVEVGDIFAVFNSQGLLEIGINNGNATELLGMNFDSPITIHFISETQETAASATTHARLYKQN